MKQKFFLSILITFLFNFLLAQNSKNIPLSTKWMLESSGKYDNNQITDVFLIVNTKNGSKGTGFLTNLGYIITNYHVVGNSAPTELTLISPTGVLPKVSKIYIDSLRDLAVIEPTQRLQGGFTLGNSSGLTLGETVYTFGFPLGYNGPAPILTVGYLSGFNAYPKPNNKVTKHLIINAAFNPGNSGGALFSSLDNSVIGIVVSKHAPIPELFESAIMVISENTNGMQFPLVDDKGNIIKYVSESQMIGDLLKYFRSMTQVVIGEAIDVNELKDFLKEQRLVK